MGHLLAAGEHRVIDRTAEADDEVSDEGCEEDNCEEATKEGAKLLPATDGHFVGHVEQVALPEKLFDLQHLACFCLFE